ncbi:MAG: putative inorganic carbon transporter subunit DabA, partial [Armatimonadota bacterium]
MHHPSADSAHPAVPRSETGHAIDHAAHALPAQGPIGVFIHHNTLHAYQHLPFEQAVVAAAARFHTEPYMTEVAYQARRAEGRILDEDIDAVLGDNADPIVREWLEPASRPLTATNHRWWFEEKGFPSTKGLAERFETCLRRLPPGTHRGPTGARR